MTFDSLTAPMDGADQGRAGDCRLKRVIYPPGFRWTRDMKAIVGTELCQHAHVGFLAHGQIEFDFERDTLLGRRIETPFMDMTYRTTRGPHFNTGPPPVIPYIRGFEQ